MLALVAMGCPGAVSFVIVVCFNFLSKPIITTGFDMGERLLIALIPAATFTDFYSPFASGSSIRLLRGLLFFRNLCDPVCRTKSLFVALESRRVGDDSTDARAPYLRGCKMETDPLILTRYLKVSPSSAGAYTLTSVAELAEQVATRLDLSDESTCEKNAHTFASRIGILNIPKEHAEKAYQGSAQVASAIVSVRRLQLQGVPFIGEVDGLTIFLTALFAVYTPMSLAGILLAFFRDVLSWPSLLASVMPVGSWSRLVSLLNLIFAHLISKTAGSWGVLSDLVPFQPASLFFCGSATVIMSPILEELLLGMLEIPFGVDAHLLYGSIEVLYRVACGDKIQSSYLSMAFHASKLFVPPHVRIVLHLCFNAACWVQPSRPSSVALFASGYRLGDRSVAEIPKKPATQVKFSLHGNFNDVVPRATMMASLGPTLAHFAPPIPDRNHGPSILHGVTNRFCCDPPVPDRKLLREFKKFVKKSVVNIPPVEPDADLSVEHWLENTDYPLWRKKQLLEGWNEAGRRLTRCDEHLKGFMKTETYGKWAAPRGINSRSDNFKCAFGPYAKAMENIVYRDPAFIKHVPVKDRPQYIDDMMRGQSGPFYETDYTAFECHFTAEIMDACEFVLYRHLLQHFPKETENFIRILGGQNKIAYKFFTVSIRARRMSGEMVTSLGNGFSNLMLARFVAKKSRARITGVVEGDDGLFATSSELKEELFLKLGFTIKIIKHSNLLHSSFCGMMMADDLTSFTDPFEALVNFGWSHSQLAINSSKNRRRLLRAKSLSLLYEHPNCPLLAALALRMIDLTEDVSPRFTSQWYERKLESETIRYADHTLSRAREGPSSTARFAFSELYGVSPRQQVEFERYISTWDGGVIDHPVVNYLAVDKAAHADFHTDYVSDSARNG